MSEVVAIVVNRQVADVAVVRLIGDHDVTTAADIHARITEALETGSVVVDLSEASFIDSSCLRALVESREAADRLDRRFALQLPAGAAVRRALEVAGLLGTFPVAETRDEAIGLARQL